MIVTDKRGQIVQVLRNLFDANLLWVNLNILEERKS